MYIYEEKVVPYQDAYLDLCLGDKTSYMYDFQKNVWPVWNSILHLYNSLKSDKNMQEKILFER